jgi:hypothetical protein
MAYSTSSPPALTAQSIAGGRTWTYRSTELSTIVSGTGFFSNGVSLGMRTGDFLISQNTSIPLATHHTVKSSSGDTITVSTASSTL